jgi:hypothetical protein
MGNPHNTSISKVAHWDWRLPPADRRNGEVKTYYLSQEELAKYRKGGEKKMEEVQKYQADEKERSLKQILREDFATGKKTLNEIAEEIGMKPWLVKAAAARLGYIEKKEKPGKAETPRTDVVDVSLKQVEFSGKFSYHFRDGKLTIRQDKERRLVLAVDEIDLLLGDLRKVLERINALV